jgi:hypothetical protein
MVISTDRLLLRRLETVESLGSRATCSWCRHRSHAWDIKVRAWWDTVITAMVAEDLLDASHKARGVVALVTHLRGAVTSICTGVVFYATAVVVFSQIVIVAPTG